MVDKRIKISSVVENQLPSFVREDFPLVGEFLSQYYTALENQGGILDILQNIDQYIKLENLTNLVESTTTTSSISFSDSTINVVSTYGFPNSYGLLKIGSEIITYTSKTDTTFNGCVRGFSGTTSYQDQLRPDHLVFTDSQAEQHNSGDSVSNLSILFLKEFFKKVKRQFVPGFEERDFYSDLNENLFVKQSKDFYSSKGTDQSFEILFRALYGEDVEVIKPRDYLFIPSDAQYRVVRNLVVEAIEGNPEDLENRTLYQDEDTYLQKAYGSINKVEKIYRSNKEYHVISLDYDYNKDINVKGSIFGNFGIHSQTKIIDSVSIGETVLDVDSTVGFPNSGQLVADLPNGTSLVIDYTSKSYTQFYGCSGITQSVESGQTVRINSYAYGYAGIGTENVVKVRVTGVLSDLQLDSDSRYYDSGDSIKIRTLGKDSSDIRANNWIFNISTTYDIESISLIDSSNFTYRIVTVDENDFYTGDSIKLIQNDGTEIVSSILSVSNKNTFTITDQGQIDTSRKNKVQRLISKANFSNFPESSLYSTNVQNVYEDSQGSYYVTSSSLPTYFNDQLTVTDKSVTFSGTFNGTDLVIGNHGFYTGDAVVYKPQSDSNSLNISEGIYYVRKVNSTTINLSRSRSNLYNSNYISVSGTVTDNKFELNEFANQSLDSQKLIRNIYTPQEDTEVHETSFGPTGILVNGVEILNYKSKDKIFYGGIEEINVLSPGSNYDVINPPVLSIVDSVGTGATGYCEVHGTVEKINIIDGGFNYITEPIVSITGGGGSGAKAKAKLFNFEHSATFNSIASANLVNLTNNTIGFSSFHKFGDGERVVYKPDGQQAVGGLSTDSTYYAAVQDAYTIKVHTRYEDAISGVNTVSLTSYGVGNHRFASANLKRKISSIDVYDKGSGYKNRKVSVPSSGISTSSNVVFAKNHNYNTGDVIVYSSTGTDIEGLTSGSSYYVTAVDSNSFKLSRVGTSTTVGVGSAIVGVTTSVDFYFKTSQYIDFISSGSGNHEFNYPPISVTVTGVVGVSTRTGQDFNAVVQPIVRGEIKSIFVESGGSNYGSEEILNFNRQPSISLRSGSGAEVVPVISNGKITEVLVSSPGSGYNAPPSFEIIGGTNAVLTPVLSNGTLSEVKVIYGGVGFETSRTIINVIPAGSGASLQSVAKSWTINLVERNIQSNQITDDDGIIDNGINSNYGLQYTHAYAARKLRQTVLSQKLVNGNIVFSPDLKLVNGRESLSDSHSPIIGWAYDGNPIYGPYGYSSSTGGSVKALESGYKLALSSGRPSTTLYPQGFFVEDYQYNADGDLDEYNGRFCITPDYPNGVYAYFATIDGFGVESSGIFRNYRKPVFPYFIGNEFKSKPIDYNFRTSSNQDDIDLNSTQLVRNTTPYKLLNSRSGYDFVLNPNDIKKQNTIVSYSSAGSIDSIGIQTGGTNYKVGDRVIFNNEGTGGQGASVEVSLVKGKTVNQISNSQVSLTDVEFVPASGQGKFLGFSTSPHNLSNFDVITITGINTFATNLSGSYNIGVRSDTFLLSSGIGSTSVTGIVTYFSLLGRLDYPYIRENDILQIESEKVKVLNIDSKSSRIRVLRSYDGTVGFAHTTSTVLYEQSRKFSFDSNVTSTLYEYRYNKEIYFDPSESIGIGTLSGVGIGYTLNFSNPGVGVSSLFIPTRAIYLPNHNLNTGDKLIYSTNNGTAISVSTDGSSSFQLGENEILYAAKINENLIGISSNRVGVGSTGGFVGINSSVITDILYFTNVGSGVVHSFTTNYPDVIIGEVDKNRVTVSLASTHGLNVNDNVNISCLPGITTTYVVRYNDYNRRLVLNPKNFSSGNVNAIDDTITINSHGYEDGQKVIHTSSSPAGGLKNNKIYYIVKVDNNKFKLSETYYNSIIDNPEVVNITSASSGTISLVNPPIKAIKNQSIVFDLTDSSLSYLKNSSRYPAFDFNFYTDSQLKNIFETSTNTNKFEVSKSGTVGVTTNANTTIVVSDEIPKVLYYSLVPLNTDENDFTKNEIINDSVNVLDHNKLLVGDSVYSGSYSIVGITSTSFSYNLIQSPEKSSYISSEANISYTTNSLTAFGEIERFNVISGGRNYKNLPGITSISSLYGSGSIITPSSTTIGNIVSTEIQDIGFEYSADKTIRPTAKASQILNIIPLSTFKRIGISSVGKNYTIAPNLVVIDSATNSVINDVDLTYDLGDSEVTILRNTKGINNVTPTIIPINNTNGVGIASITFNTSTKDVTVALAVSYSDSANYPFAVGDKVLVENTSIGIGTTLRGYNSSEYGYSLFTLNAIDPNIGGSNGTVTYNIGDLLSNGEEPGTFSSVYSSGVITPQKFFPIFDIELEKNEFFRGETVTSGNVSGIVERWDSSNELLKVSSSDAFSSGSVIVGGSSNSQARVSTVEEYDGIYTVSSSSIVKQGWQLETGFLNNNFQRLHDSDYYQYFSYSIKSKVQYEDWNDPVSAMNHTAGFKKFSDLIVESREDAFAGITTDQNSGDFSGIADLTRVIDLNCVNDFDLATERTLTIGSNIISDEIVLSSATLQDYFESVGNRVLIIDDISDQFNSNPRSTPFSIVGTFRLDSGRVRKFITYVKDRRFTAERQLYIVTLLHNDSESYLNQYGRLETVSNMGSFDVSISGDEGNLLFYPIDSEVNNFDVSYVSYNLKDSISGVGTFRLGNVVDIQTSNQLIPSGTTTPTTIVGIASTYRSSKVLVEIGGTDGNYYEFDEVTIVHDGTNIELIDYGQLTDDNLTLFSSIGLGTYGASYSGSNIDLYFTPYVGVGVSYVINTLRVSIGDTTSSGVGTETLDTSDLESNYVSIASSTSPVENVISQYDNSEYNAAYYIVSVDDLTNNRAQVSEVVVVDDGSTASITEFGELFTHSGLGTVGVGISGSNVQLYFTPIAGISAEVRTFQNSLRVVNPAFTNDFIDLTSGSIDTGYGEYRGTFVDVRRQFNLTHDGLPIFRRDFDGSDSSIVSVSNNTVRIPNHFYVTGEQLTYTHSGAGTTQAIGISTTSIVGFGTTDRLPSTVYAIRVDDLNIKLAASVENALKPVPVELEITTVGIGTSHTFTTTNQNARALVSIDNVIQSPIVSTAVTTTLALESLVTDDIVTLTGITSIFGGDLLKINNEIVKVNSVGFGSTNVLLVERAWMGTGLGTHAQYDLVTKVTGNYNIVDNSINFASAPYGPVPIGTSSNAPDERDWTGITTHSTFSGRTFMRSGVVNTTIEPYSRNYIFDDVSDSFTGIATEFTLKSNRTDVSGFSTSNAIVLVNEIFQGPQRRTSPISINGDYTLFEGVGISSIQFTGTATSALYDINTSNVPVGGVIISVGSTSGFGYQPLVAAGGTAVVSVSGTIQSISIGNSGSGYREGVQSVVNVGVATSSTGTVNIEFIGTASVSGGNIVSVAITNPGTGYTSTNPPIVIFDDPLSYTNIPLVYSSSSTSGVGTQATIDIVVGQGSSVIDFEIRNLGYGYGEGEVLTVAIGGTVGIPTNTSLSFEEFQLTIERTQSDKFSAWTIGDLQVFDTIEDLFDGNLISFPLSVNGEQRSIKAKSGSIIDVEATLLVFVNDILQVPGQGYVFDGGSFITFTEAPKPGDTCKIIFYRGTGEVDVRDVDVLETIKVGDFVRLNSDDQFLKENERIVTAIRATDTLNTNPYAGPGITNNQSLERPLIWCRQTEDLFINGQEVAKDRIIYEPLIQPNSNIIQSVGIGSTVIFVESVRTFFDSTKENTTSTIQSKVRVINQNNLVSAAATAVVSAAGTISSIVISDGGVGYTTAPTVTISNPVGLGTTQRASATSTISIGGTVSSITVSSPGTGYTSSNPPYVLIESPSPITEEIPDVVYSGDFGIISGISTTSVGVASTAIVFDFVIPENSFLRDSSIVGTAITVSGIQTGYYFTVFNSNVGNGVTSLYSSGSVLSIGSSFVDNVYEVAAVSIAQTSAFGIGVTYVAQVTVSVSDYNGLAGVGYSNFFGEYSWGRIEVPVRQNPQSFTLTNNGLVGVSTAPVVERVNPLRYLNYN